MKTKSINYLLTLLVLLVTGSLSSCHDDEKSQVKNDPEKVEKVDRIIAFRKEFNFINSFLNYAFEDSEEEGRKSFTGKNLSRMNELAPCAVATEEELPDGSIKISMDFGDGCENEEGIEVSGKAIIIFLFNENTSSFEYTLEFIDYKETGSEAEFEGVANGTSTGNFVFDLENSKLIQEMEQYFTITYEDNTEAIYHLTQELEETETELRITELEISGSLASGEQFTLTKSKTIVFDFSCESEFPVKGEEVLTFQGSTIKVNYGNGTCDSDYTVE